MSDVRKGKNGGMVRLLGEASAGALGDRFGPSGGSGVGATPQRKPPSVPGLRRSLRAQHLSLVSRGALTHLAPSVTVSADAAFRFILSARAINQAQTVSLFRSPPQIIHQRSQLGHL